MARMSLACAAALALAAPAQAENVERWRPHIAEASARFGVPQEWIVKVMRAESGGRPGAISPKGAMGLMQLMPGTWAEMRGRLGLGADPYRPRDNILAGTYYLKLMHDRFGYPGLFAAYNAGPKRYAEHVAGKRGLPSETKAYLASLAGSQPSSLIAASNAPDPRRSAIFFSLGRNGPGR